MLPRDVLRDLLSQDLSNTDKVLVCMAVDADKPKKVREIVALAVDGGLRAARKWNISNMLARAKGHVVPVTGGWALTSKGIEHVATVAGPLAASPIPRVASSLRAHLSRVSNPDSQRFVEEAVSCFESRQYRAATVLSWVGAIAVLYDHVVAHALQPFNAEATTRLANSKHPWTAAKNSDDLARLKERDFLSVLEKCSVIGKSVRLELERCLDLRNGCGHPNSLQIADHAVASHIEILILNIYSRF